MDSGIPRRRRARLVGDAPIDPLLARVDDLAKGWLLALLERVPLAQASSVLAADVARVGPRICDAAVRALADDRELERLAPGGALRQLAFSAGEVSGSGDPAAISGAIDALHGVLWSALRGELANPEPELVTELAERLALVVETLRNAALRAGAPAEPREHEPTPEEERAPRTELEPERAPRTGLEPERAPRTEPEPAPRPTPVPAPKSSERSSGATEALWIAAFEEEIARATQTGVPLALLLAELEESERLTAAEPPSVATATIGRFAQAIRDTVRRPDILASESDSRVWIIARDTGRSGAQALASRVARAVRSAEPWRGAPLTIALGIAILGEDGRDAASLIAAAEESRFAAAASGVPVVLAVDEERTPPPPSTGL